MLKRKKLIEFFTNQLNMKKTKYLILAIALCFISGSLNAQLPSLINYQGRLTNKDGTPVNGSINIAINIYDSETVGKLFYTENLGQVPISNGIYSFDYGSGQSLAESTEVMAVGDGEEKVFVYDVSKGPIIGDVTITDGVNTWNSADPNQQSEILGTVNKAAGNVRAIFLNTAPIKGQEILVDYEHNEDGIFGSLVRLTQPWLELFIDGKPLSPRQRIVTVPYASVAKYSLKNEVADKNKVLLDKVANIVLNQNQEFSFFPDNRDIYKLNSQNITTIKLDMEDANESVFYGKNEKPSHFGFRHRIIRDKTNMHHNNNGLYLYGDRQVNKDNADLIIKHLETDYIPYLFSFQRNGTAHFADGSSIVSSSQGRYHVYHRTFLNPNPRNEVIRLSSDNGICDFHSIHHVFFETYFPVYQIEAPQKFEIYFDGINIDRIFKYFYVTIKILHKPDVEPIKILKNPTEFSWDYSKQGNVHVDFTLKDFVEVKPFDINMIIKRIRFTVK
jgi:hypothetical protein